MRNACCRQGVMLLTVFVGLAVGDLLYGATFVVAPNGRDDNPGTNEQPLATLGAARDAARKASAGPHGITVMPGDYFLTKTLELDARDNGLTIEAGEGGPVTLYGGTVVTGWQPDGDKLWYAELPGVKDGTWDFRALVVNGRLADRARFPEDGTFTHKTEWKGARYISGAWDPQPTREQRTTILYDPKDIPPTLDIKNAEIRVYHMWNEALYGIEQNDQQRQALILSSPAVHPPGAFGVKKYVLFNTREGMTRPGQWYLDRPAGRLVYWPLPGEEMAKARVVAPRLQRIIQIVGTAKQPVETITLRGLKLQATTTLLGDRGYTFGANSYEGAVHLERSRHCLLEKLDITNIGGEGIVVESRNEVCRIIGCHIHHIGACAVEISCRGEGSKIAQNHIHHVGLQYPCAVGMLASGDNLHIYRNEIHDIPYSGVVCNGGEHCLEENLISRVMQQMHDGAAIYGHMVGSVLRGNLVRDVVEQGKGYSASAYYLDEQSRDCLVERNVAIGVPMPTHNHISRDLVFRDNVFIVEKNMKLSFARSANCTFERNMLFVPGKLTISTPNAIATWKDNVVFRGGLGKDGASQTFTIDAAMPPAPQPGRRGAAAVVRATEAPTLDGEIGSEEWPGPALRLDRDPSRWGASGVPISAEVSYDDRFLYVAVSAGIYDIKKLSEGNVWGKDDGAEIAIAGKTPEEEPATFVIRGYPSGTVQSVTDAGAPAAAAKRLEKAIRFATTTWRHGWRGEWSIPLDSLGLKPAPGVKVPFNLVVFRAEDEVWRCWEGTLAETWQLDQAGTLQFK